MRRRLIGVVLSLLLLAGNMVSCAPWSSASEATVTYMDVFDTVTTVTAYGLDKEKFDADAARLHTLLEEYHRLYDIYQSYSGVNNLRTVNEAAGGSPVAVDSRILDLLEYGLEMGEHTDGRVNIVFGAVLSLWHDSRQAGLDNPATAALPDGEALQAAAMHTAPSALVLNRENGTVTITDPLARVDVGAIAKGYVAERVARYAADTLGWRSALINLGGNIRVVGGKGTADTPFTIGIQNPDTTSAQTYVATVSVRDAAVVTSGDYQRFYTVDGQTYAHIIDPDTLFPATYMRSVSVIAADSGLADALSTALFTLPVDKGQALLEKHADAQALWVLADGTVCTSKGFDAYR